MDIPVINKILQDIKIAYGSYETPSYDFVIKKYEEDPYKDLINDISKIFYVIDSTDINDDVSFNYQIRYGEKEWHLAISMVGQYAIFYRIVKEEFANYLDSYKVLLDEEKKIIYLLDNFGLQILTEQILKYTIDFNMPNNENSKVTIYQCLFSEY